MNVPDKTVLAFLCNIKQLKLKYYWISNVHYFVENIVRTNGYRNNTMKDFGSL